MDKVTAIQTLAAKQRDRFLVDREKYINQVRSFMAGVNKLPAKVFDNIEPNFHGKTAEEIFPRLLSETPKNEEIVHEQNQFTLFYDSVMEIRKTYVEETYEKMTAPDSK